jgi:phage FluMu protein Com
MKEMRCARCSKKLAVAEFKKLEIKCPRCGNLNRWMADAIPVNSPDPTLERPERLSTHESATHENRSHHSLARRQAPPG